jgi:hypothetical protein
MTLALPVVWNYYRTGKVSFEQPAGVPVGGLYLDDDENGKPRYFDPLQLNLMRRGLRISGVQAGLRGAQTGIGLAETSKGMVHDVFAGKVHPWAGPTARFLWTAVSGREPSYPVQEGMLLSQNPHSPAQNAIAALENMNPLIAAQIQDRSSLPGAIGMKTGRFPSFAEFVKQETGGRDYEALPLKEKREIVKKFEEHKKLRPRDRSFVQASRAGAERDLWRSFSRTDALKAELPEAQRAFLKQHNLVLPGYEPEVTVKGVRMPTTLEERNRFAVEVAKQYTIQIDRFMNMKQIEQFKKKGVLQEVLNRHLEAARERARAVALRGLRGSVKE